MTRRQALTSGVGLAATALAGCVGDPDPESRPSDSASDGGPSGRDDQPTAEQQWTQFGADAQNTGHEPAVTGPGTGEPSVAWRYDAGTPTMNTSPVVADGVVYASGSGDPGLIHAIDTDTREQLWEFQPAGYVSSALVVVQDTLYFGTWGKRFYALDRETGDPRWNRDIGHRFGASAPTVVDGTVYVGTSGDGPLVVSGPEDEEQFESGALLALDSETGDREWAYDEFGERENVTSSPAVADGRVYFGSERGVHALDAKTGEPVWKRSIGTHPESSPAVVDGTVYYGAPSDTEADTPATLWALDAASGETLWTAGIDDQSLRTSPAVADGTVYVAASSTRVCVDAGGEEPDCSGVTRGRLYAVDVETGDSQWMTPIKTDTRSSPAVVDGVVYVGCRDGLSAVTTDGENAWRVAFEGERENGPYVKSSPAVAGGLVFVGGSDGRLRAIEATEG